MDSRDGSLQLSPGFLRLFAWTKDFVPSTMKSTKTHAWVRIYHFPLKYWRPSDTIQGVKDSKDNSNCEQSFQQSSQGPNKYQTDLTRTRTWHRPEHQLFFLLVFLKDKNMFVNNLGSLLWSK